MRTIVSFVFLCACLSFTRAQTIRITTQQTDLILKVAPTKRLYQAYLGDKLQVASDVEKLEAYVKSSSDGSVSTRGWEVYPGSGGEDYFEPALTVSHNDGNLTTILQYVSHNVKKIDDNVTLTSILLKDSVYGTLVQLYYEAFARENIIKTWTEITSPEKKAVTLGSYASALLYLSDPHYYLTEFSGDWAKEGKRSTQELFYGKKILDTKLGSRAAMFVSPFFQLGLGEEATETRGKVMVGTLGWTGNFRFTFEVDNAGVLRILPAINPSASDYEMQPNTVFRTPEFIFTYSNSGTGTASRNFQAWARKYQLKDGEGDRLTLLNNWESTGFRFNEPIMDTMMQEAKQLGVDMFLLDDGWFANKYPRNNDRQGLGDWEVNRAKLPDGIPFLVKAAEKNGVKFGLWIEPEMVNPKSELFEKHPDWAILLPNRTPYYFRHQLVLDLSNPAVQAYVFGVVDKLMTENPGIAYFKWDCNSPITNIYSPYLKEKQQQLYINHVRGLYNIFQKIKAKYPHLPIMLCSGGGARCDYEALKYFTEFWCSDNTDPYERLYIQWSFSQIFPAKAMAAHITGWNEHTSIKFRTDVAMMCKLGFDINMRSLPEKEQAFCRQAVQNYNRLKPQILDGIQYRLAAPYESNHAAVMYTDDKSDRAVVFAYDLHPRFSEILYKLKLQGLDPGKNYTVHEINLMPDESSRFKQDGQTFSGDYLMKIGLDAFTAQEGHSRVIELVAAP